MGETELDERCEDCDTRLIRIDEDDVVNPHNAPAVTCPGCLTLVRVER